MKLKVFKLEGIPLSYQCTKAIVAAPDAPTAGACMMVGSDSCWESVVSCKEIDEAEFDQEYLADKYRNCDGYLLCGYGKHALD